MGADDEGAELGSTGAAPSLDAVAISDGVRARWTLGVLRGLKLDADGEPHRAAAVGRLGEPAQEIQPLGWQQLPIGRDLEQSPALSAALVHERQPPRQLPRLRT